MRARTTAAASSAPDDQAAERPTQTSSAAVIQTMGLRARLAVRSANRPLAPMGHTANLTSGSFSSGSLEIGKNTKNARSARNGYELAGSTPLTSAPQINNATNRKKL